MQDFLGTERPVINVRIVARLLLFSIRAWEGERKTLYTANVRLDTMEMGFFAANAELVITTHRSSHPALVRIPPTQLNVFATQDFMVMVTTAPNAKVVMEMLQALANVRWRHYMIR